MNDETADEVLFDREALHERAAAAFAAFYHDIWLMLLAAIANMHRYKDHPISSPPSTG